jgi:hypothetical protein
VSEAGAPRQSDEVRRLVRGMLENAGAFSQLAPDERREMANNLVQVLSYVSDETGGLPGVQPTARALDDANAALKERLAKKQDLVGKDFVAGAGKAGVADFKALVTAVDFPKFVSGLIQGVYISIVDASIKQMQEYGKLLAGVVKSAQEFADENVSVGSARSFLMQTFPNSLEMEQGDDGQQRLKLKDDLDDKDRPDFKKVLQMQEDIQLSEENETKIVAAAQLSLARSRQRQLAMMIAMGINRIIVTDGEIKATVLFDMKAKDRAARQTFASTSDDTTGSTSTSSGGGLWSSGGDQDVTTSVSSAYSQEAAQSQSELDLKAKLSGSVTVKFKSETFPLERMASAEELGAVQSKAGK